MKASRLLLLASVVLALASCFVAHAQSSLGTTGTPATVTCPAYFYPTTCKSIPINCPNTTTITATYGYAIPLSPTGTIIYFNGGGGTSSGPEDYAYGQDYYGLNFGIVQVQWSDPWEDTNSGTTTTTYTPNIAVAACRPATFLNFVHGNSTLYHSSTGFCGQGVSGGAGALGYALAWYGAGTSSSSFRLDNAELLDGPMFSDLEQGCAESGGVGAPDVAVCPSTQTGCVAGWPSAGVNNSPIYQYGSQVGIGNYTGHIGDCATNPNTGSTENMNWLHQSVVDTGNSSLNYAYPKTSVSGWLCGTVQRPAPMCDGVNGFLHCPNNSTSQGYLFLKQAANSASSTYPTKINEIVACYGPEGISGGTDNNGLDGMTAVEDDMGSRCSYHP